MASITLGRYMPYDSVIHRMDPRAKILAMLILLISIFFPSGWIGYGITFLAVTVVILLGKLSFKYVWLSMKPMLLMMVFLLIVNSFVLTDGIRLFGIGGWGLYTGAIIQTAYIAVRLLLMVMITTCLTATTKPLDMTLGIEDLLSPFKVIHVPAHEIAMLISIALRFIPDLIEETERIIKAQESRGVDLKEGKLKEKIMAILSLIVPLFVSAFQRAEDLANAMEARGYRGEYGRKRKKIHYAKADVLSIILSILVFAGAAALGGVY